MATYQQLEAQRDLIERTLIAAQREVDRLDAARVAVHERIWRLIHNGALGPTADRSERPRGMFCSRCLTDHMTDETCDYVTVNEFGEPVTRQEG